ncbi:unnamed protein product [Caenorhabditis bovis]|uniref:Uncharacterized protein n=1 Tax=Caenorhabditis bovis TaxID=2654633 RepID=A0A8S1EHM9_9PELO|nr:unnamed protein product [Caenorhabditis bovis]
MSDLNHALTSTNKTLFVEDFNSHEKENDDFAMNVLSPSGTASFAETDRIETKSNTEESKNILPTLPVVAAPDTAGYPESDTIDEIMVELRLDDPDHVIGEAQADRDSSTAPSRSGTPVQPNSVPHSAHSSALTSRSQSLDSVASTISEKFHWNASFQALMDAQLDKVAGYIIHANSGMKHAFSVDCLYGEDENYAADELNSKHAEEKQEEGESLVTPTKENPKPAVKRVIRFTVVRFDN